MLLYCVFFFLKLRLWKFFPCAMLRTERRSSWLFMNIRKKGGLGLYLMNQQLDFLSLQLLCQIKAFIDLLVMAISLTCQKGPLKNIIIIVCHRVLLSTFLITCSFFSFRDPLEGLRAREMVPWGIPHICWLHCIQGVFLETLAIFRWETLPYLFLGRPEHEAGWDWWGTGCYHVNLGKWVRC